MIIVPVEVSNRISGLIRSNGILGLGSGSRKNVMAHILEKEFPDISKEIIWHKVLEAFIKWDLKHGYEPNQEDVKLLESLNG